MSTIARHRLQRGAFPVDLILGYAQNLAFASNSFSQVVATFPSDYIFEKPTLFEIYRVLAQDGQLVVILGGWLTGHSRCQRLLGWLLRSTARHELDHFQRWLEPFQKAGFDTQVSIFDLEDSQIFMVLATK
jgi:SAM-dependent methyltransferase